MKLKIGTKIVIFMYNPDNKKIETIEIFQSVDGDYRKVNFWYGIIREIVVETIYKDIPEDRTES